MKQTICLNMIVKNERRVIERCLASVKPFIDAWVIVDTGSTDGTQELIRAFLRDIPGELFERPWVDFSHNRNEALQLAKDKGVFLMHIDADDVLVAEPGFALPPLSEDLYLVEARHPQSNFRFSKMFLIREKLNWFWEGALHEMLNTKDPVSARSIPQLKILYLNDGARGCDPQLLEKDIALLLRALEKEPHHPRYLFYLAQNYRGTGQLEKALATYEKRVALGGSEEEEIFYCLYQIARLTECLSFPHATIVSRYKAAYAYRPSRIEPLFYLALYLLMRDEPPREAYKLLQEARKKPLSRDYYFVEAWIGEWGLFISLGEAAHRLGLYEEAKRAFHHFFSHPKTPPDAAAKIRERLSHCPFYLPAISQLESSVRKDRNAFLS